MTVTKPAPTDLRIGVRFRTSSARLTFDVIEGRKHFSTHWLRQIYWEWVLAAPFSERDSRSKAVPPDLPVRFELTELVPSAAVLNALPGSTSLAPDFERKSSGTTGTDVLLVLPQSSDERA